MIIFADAKLCDVKADALNQLAANCLRDGIGMAGGRILSNDGTLAFGRMEYDAEGKLTHADAGLQKGFKDRDGNLFFEITRIIDSKRPKVVFLENVPNLIEHDNG